MLYIKDLCGVYQPAPKETILSEARKLSGYQFRRGAAILSPTAAKEAIGLKLTGLEHEVFGCLFLDSRHQVLAWREMFRGSINRNSVHPREVVKAGDIVRVKVLEVDAPRKRISLTMRLDEKAGQPARKPAETRNSSAGNAKPRNEPRQSTPMGGAMGNAFAAALSKAKK